MLNSITYLSKGFIPHICAAELISHVTFKEIVYRKIDATYHEALNVSPQKNIGMNVGRKKQKIGIRIK